jgi:hypothetical protein
VTLGAGGEFSADSTGSSGRSAGGAAAFTVGFVFGVGLGFEGAAALGEARRFAATGNAFGRAARRFAAGAAFGGTARRGDGFDVFGLARAGLTRAGLLRAAGLGWTLAAAAPGGGAGFGARA